MTDTRDRLRRLESLVEELHDRIESQQEVIDRQRVLITRLDDRADTPETTGVDDSEPPSPGHGEGADDPPVTRRSALKAGGLLGLLGLGAGTAAADPQGKIGTAGDPLKALYTESLRGGVTGGSDDAETPVSNLVGENLSVSEAGDLEATDTHVTVSNSIRTVEGVEDIEAGQGLDLYGEGPSVTLAADVETGGGADTHTDVSDDGSTVVEDTDDVNFGSGLSVTDDGDGSATVTFSGSGAAWEDSGGTAGLLEPTDTGITGIEQTDTVQSSSGNGLTFNIDGGTRASVLAPGTTDVADAGSSVAAPNVILGHPNNSTGGAGPEGATVAGGEDNEASGNYATVAGGGPPDSNEAGGSGGCVASARHATVAGGESNKARAENATLAGGRRNKIKSNAYSSFLGGGFDNVVQDGANAAAIAGGENHDAKMPKSFIGAGDENQTGPGDSFPEAAAVVAGTDNTAEAHKSFIGAGASNTVKDKYGVIVGGDNNEIGEFDDFTESDQSYAFIGGGKDHEIRAAGKYGVIGGGRKHLVEGDFATVCGGESNEATGKYAFVGGGGGQTGDGLFVNEAKGLGSTVAGGQDNVASGKLATVGGGGGDTGTGSFEGNEASAEHATVSGGSENTASGKNSTVGGGVLNSATVQGATVGGGEENEAKGAYAATVAGGFANFATAKYAAIGGGKQNQATKERATVAGGTKNDAKATNATVGGGKHNDATGSRATVPGGVNNTASGIESLACGAAAGATDDNAFVWNDGSGASDSAGNGGDQFTSSTSTNATSTPTGSNTFSVKATSGVRFVTSADNSSHAWIDTNGDIEASGAKNFVETVDTDEGERTVTYTALEAPAARTEVSGVATVADGYAEISLPDHFAWVTDGDEQLVVQVTPHATDAVSPQVTARSTDHVLIEDPGDGPDSYEVSYTVKGTREGYADKTVVSDPDEGEETGDESERGAGPSADADRQGGGENSGRSSDRTGRNPEAADRDDDRTDGPDAASLRAENDRLRDRNAELESRLDRIEAHVGLDGSDGRGVADD